MTTMGNASRITRHMSHIVGANAPTLTESKAMAAAYNSAKAKSVDPTQKKKPKKPWVKNEKATTAAALRNKFRRGLLKTVDDKKREFKLVTRVSSRLQQATGTVLWKPFDLSYWETLTEKIKDLDQVEFDQKTVVRQKVELQRRRQLVIDGYAEAGPGEESLYLHPVLRCKRILARANKENNLGGKPIMVGGIPLPPPQKLKLNLKDPFDEWEKTGLLFGQHKNHYLKVKPVTTKAQISTKAALPKTRVENEEDLLNVAEGDGASLLVLEGSQLESWRDSSEVGNDTQASAQGKGSVENVETGSKDDVLDKNLASTAQKNRRTSLGSGSFSDGGRMSKESDRTSETDDDGVTDDLSGQDAEDLMKRVQRHLPMAELEKLYQQLRSQLVDEVYKENQELADSLFDVGTAVITAYQREQAKVDEFCKNAHRKALGS